MTPEQKAAAIVDEFGKDPDELREAIAATLWDERCKGEPKCRFCNKRPATLLCDFILGFEIAGWSPSTPEQAAKVGRVHEYVADKGLPYQNIDSEQFTCDAPMCDECAKNVGTTFFCGEAGGVETRDLCPVHANNPEHLRVFTAGEAEAIRLKTWKMRIAKVDTKEKSPTATKP